MKQMVQYSADDMLSPEAMKKLEELIPLATEQGTAIVILAQKLDNENGFALGGNFEAAGDALNLLAKVTFSIIGGNYTEAPHATDKA